ncbi:acetate/propionate family kinase [Deminuibacter soli]|uniref:Acetate kinase n=1 Tax=Deminuibacter soli TaxID=2291815 RepID=A0A3E1NH77_9BACT|nr:acetate/propionate family kinase [Deminuibacter soli]RFM27285.1 acetate/propionate family kinase [Deminuibacter soli]
MEQGSILTVNGGSSSIKFALYNVGLQLQVKGKIEGIGTAHARFSFKQASGTQQPEKNIEAKDLEAAATFFAEWLQQQSYANRLLAIGHRIVHGMQYTQPAFVDAQLLKALRDISAYDPDHLPGEIALIQKMQSIFPRLPQVVCFDTAFHTGLPAVARLLPIPRRYAKQGIHRYGFHGLSYAYVLQQLQQAAGESVANGRVILAHLGNGSSLAAVQAGKSIDTTMGFTPTGGTMMGTRPGDLDPGIVSFLLRHEKMSPAALNNLLNHDCGLLGVSETSADMQELLQQEASSDNAAVAINMYCYQVKKWIGAFTAALGGLDALVFTGGIGENAAVVRSRICAGLNYLGITLDETRNNAHELLVSSGSGHVPVYVIATNEEYMIAQQTLTLITHHS